jgi:hypothetical protein
VTAGVVVSSLIVLVIVLAAVWDQWRRDLNVRFADDRFEYRIRKGLSRLRGPEDEAYAAVLSSCAFAAAAVLDHRLGVGGLSSPTMTSEFLAASDEWDLDVTPGWSVRVPPRLIVVREDREDGAA